MTDRPTRSIPLSMGNNSGNGPTGYPPYPGPPGGPGNGGGGGGGPPYSGTGFPRHQGSHGPSPIDLFLKGQKRDATAFTTLAKDSQYNMWHRHFRAHIIAQGLHAVLDPNFAPLSQDDHTLFQMKQDYVYAIFTTILKTHQGKNLVMKYEYNRDARSLYLELHRFYTESTQASLDAQNVMTWLTTAWGQERHYQYSPPLECRSTLFRRRPSR